MSENEEACAAAISVLREYYEGESLLQVKSEANSRGDGSGILGVLEIAESDFDMKGKQSELKSLKTSLADYNEDKESVTGELNAVLDHLNKLKPQCETKVLIASHKQTDLRRT